MMRNTAQAVRSSFMMHICVSWRPHVSSASMFHDILWLRELIEAETQVTSGPNYFPIKYFEEKLTPEGAKIISIKIILIFPQKMRKNMWSSHFPIMYACSEIIEELLFIQSKNPDAFGTAASTLAFNSRTNARKHSHTLAWHSKSTFDSCGNATVPSSR